MNKRKMIIIGIGFIFLAVLVAGIIIWRSIKNSSSSSSDTKYTCNVDSDCKVKDVHSCCGYFPRCVNEDFEPDIDAVRKKCEETGLMSVCGFPEIDECKCIDNQCKSFQNGKEV